MFISNILRPMNIVCVQCRYMIEKIILDLAPFIPSSTCQIITILLYRQSISTCISNVYNSRSAIGSMGIYLKLDMLIR